MTSRELMLYQQIHPAKLLTDFGSSFAAGWLFWEARYIPALAVGFLPAFGVTWWLMRFSDLERMRRSWFGAYLSQHMSNKIVCARILGQLVVWLAAIGHILWLIPLGYFAIILAWLNGLWMPKRDEPAFSAP